ncbi:sigma-70 family RNA polymerase sigma factor [Actinacidiphila glaucinigra]
MPESTRGRSRAMALILSGPRGFHGRGGNPGAAGGVEGATGAARGRRRATGGGSATEGEAAVIARVRAGEREAYAELVRLHADVAHRTAVLLGAGADAEDVVQVSFVKAYRALATFRDGAAFRPWLLRIVANEARNAGRAARRLRSAVERNAVLEALPPAADDPESLAVSRERRTELLAAVRTLSEPHRLVVTCRYLLDLDEEETATVLGWPRGTVKSRLHRALARLRAVLGEPVPAGRCDDGGRRP